MTDVLEVAASVHRAALRLLRRLRQQDLEIGLSTAQASALSLIAFGPARNVGELATLEQVRPPTMTRLIDRLERAGLVARTRLADDRRQVAVAATAAGRSALEQGRQRRVAALARELRALTPAELQTLDRASRILERINDAAAKA